MTGSAEIAINNSDAQINNAAPFYSSRDRRSENGGGVHLRPGQNVIRVRLYEQEDLGGSFLGEGSIKFHVH